MVGYHVSETAYSLFMAEIHLEYGVHTVWGMYFIM